MYHLAAEHLCSGVVLVGLEMVPVDEKSQPENEIRLSNLIQMVSTGLLGSEEVTTTLGTYDDGNRELIKEHPYFAFVNARPQEALNFLGRCKVFPILNRAVARLRLPLFILDDRCAAFPGKTTTELDYSTWLTVLGKINEASFRSDVKDHYEGLAITIALIGIFLADDYNAYVNWVNKWPPYALYVPLLGDENTLRPIERSL